MSEVIAEWDLVHLDVFRAWAQGHEPRTLALATRAQMVELARTPTGYRPFVVLH